MTRKKQKNKKNLLWLWLIIILVVVGVGSYFVMSLINGDNKNKEETSEYVEQEEYDNDVITETEDVAEKAVQEKKVIQYEGDDPNNSDNLTGVVTYASVSGSTLIIRTNIDQYITSGTCSLTLVRNGATIYNGAANIIGDVSTSTCEGFDIPVSGLGSGATEIVINLSDGERTGVIRGEASI